MTWGLSQARLRDPLNPRGWLGLSKDDNAILVAWVCDRAKQITGMWTDVPIGLIPVLEGEFDTVMNRRVVAGKWPWRIDCVLQMSNVWRLIEVKPDAGHEALGQVLAYRYFAEKAIEQLKGCICTIITDHCSETAKEVFEYYDVELIEVGMVLGV